MKSTHKWAVGIAVIFGVAFLLMAAYYCWDAYFKPLDNCIQTDHLETVMRDSADIYAFDRWSICDDWPEGEPLLTLEPHELLILKFYADGLVRVSNGYAQIGTKSAVSYDIPQDVLEAILDYHNELPNP